MTFGQWVAAAVVVLVIVGIAYSAVQWWQGRGDE
jgi:hypothetical protein